MKLKLKLNILQDFGCPAFKDEFVREEEAKDDVTSITFTELDTERCVYYKCAGNTTAACDDFCALNPDLGIGQVGCQEKGAATVAVWSLPLLLMSLNAIFK